MEPEHIELSVAINQLNSPLSPLASDKNAKESGYSGNTELSTSKGTLSKNLIRRVRIRLQLLTAEYVTALEQFLNEQFLPDQCLNLALGHFADPSNTSQGRIHCKNLAHHFAQAAIQCAPIASVIAIDERNNQLIGMRLNDVNYINDDGEVEDQFDHSYVNDTATVL